LNDKILGEEYKRLNRVLEVAQICYGERSAPAYSRKQPLLIMLLERERVLQLLRRFLRKRKQLWLMNFLLMTWIWVVLLLGKFPGFVPSEDDEDIPNH
jgi:hypothetical protein